MGWTDSHGRPELKMHPDIKRGVASYRCDTSVKQTVPGTAVQAVADGSIAQPPKQAAV